MPIKMEEIWKSIPEFEGYYEASTIGNIRSSSKVLKQRLHYKGYSRINLQKNKITKTFFVHKLIAKTFLNHEICFMKEVVHHIDGNKKNNIVTNLFVCTQKENLNLSLKRNKSI